MGSQKTFNNTKLPVFLMHGFITSAIDWVSEPYTTDNLPYMLSDAGYDVWLDNNRGNIFSVHNERMDINSVEFWDTIDFDQMAELDVPAIIGYVTRATGAPKMHWVGHSQGAGVLVEALALDPSLKDRLSTSALLAPGVHMANLKVGLLKTMVATHMDTTWRKIGFDIPSIETHNKYFPGPGFSHIMEISQGTHRFVACQSNCAMTSARSWALMSATPRILTLRQWRWLTTSTQAARAFI